MASARDGELNAIEPRYEWRVWAKRLDDVSARIRSLSDRRETRESFETYIVSTTADGTNPKVRADLLDIKVLRTVRDGFEQWEPVLKAKFPVSADLLGAELLPLLGVVSPPFGRESYSLEQLLDEVVAPLPELAGAGVAKRRAMYTVNGCIAEIADVEIAGYETQTAAVESSDLEALVEARRSAGLDGYENTNYPEAIKHALGWTIG